MEQPLPTIDLTAIQNEFAGLQTNVDYIFEMWETKTEHTPS